MAKIAVSCVVDDAPKFLMQGWNWLTSLRALGTHERATVLVHHHRNVAAAVLDDYAALGATLVPIEPFGEGVARYCNKLRQLETAEILEADHVVLSDADLAFRHCPTRHAHGSLVKAKPVDMPNPPHEVWLRLIEKAGLRDLRPPVPVELMPERQTFAANFNGGLYILPGAAARRIAPLWRKWAEFCLGEEELLDPWRMHSDQIGFAMALVEAGIGFEYLETGSNLPCHLPKSVMERLEPTQIDAFHYHWRMDDEGLISPTGIEWIDRQIAGQNAVLRHMRRQFSSNTVFRGFREAFAPEVGSGRDPRGDMLRWTKASLAPFMRAFAHDSVLDVGCGDLETMRDMPLRDYRGIDPSPSALAIAQKKCPDWRFDDLRIEDFDEHSHDLVICLDGLLHQSTAKDFDGLLEHLLRVARKAVLVAGHATKPVGDSLVFSRPLREVLAARSDIADVVEIGSHRDVTLFLAIRKAAMADNTHDISLPDLAFGCSETPNWEILLELVSLSRKRLGFFPETIIRTIEYPWFAHRLWQHREARILDIGAGVCVLPLWLAERGHSVVTLDNHSLVRDPDDRRDWNEWGFLDYGRIDTRVTSLNIDASIYAPDEPFEAIYSVSVLEHLPAATRQEIIGKLGDWLAPGGRIYLSFDLVPDSNRLWPLSEGRVVEPEDDHGTLESVLDELKAAGLRIVETSVRRSIRSSRTDLAFIEAARLAR